MNTRSIVEQYDPVVAESVALSPSHDGPSDIVMTVLADQTAPLNSGIRIAYLITEYPKVSHTFIRREILALERLGVTVDRIALRGWDADVADPSDEAERGRTRYVLKGGVLPLLGAMARTLVRWPGAFWTALRAAIALSRPALRPLPYHLIYLAHACQIRIWLEAEPVQHLHAHFGTNSTETALLLRLLGGPDYSFTVHGADEADHAKYLHLDRKVAGAKHAVAISSYTRSQLFRHIPPADWPKVAIVHCGLEDSFFAEDPVAFPTDPVFLCIGRLSSEKGHTILLDAFADVVRQRPDCRLVLAGDGPLRCQIEAQIDALGLKAHVQITGWISSGEVRRQIEAATILVQPSFQEGLPVVIMEAMALGRPVLSTYVAGIPELVQPGETGWLVPAGDVAALGEAMATATDTPAETLADMGAVAISRVHARHHVDTEARKLLDLFLVPTPDT